MKVELMKKVKRYEKGKAAKNLCKTKRCAAKPENMLLSTMEKQISLKHLVCIWLSVFVCVCV